MTMTDDFGFLYCACPKSSAIPWFKCERCRPSWPETAARKAAAFDALPIHLRANRSRYASNYAMTKGIVPVPEACEHCGAEMVRLYGHHVDTSYRWRSRLVLEHLCQKCHMAEHRRLRDEAPGVDSPRRSERGSTTP
jgi:hypothetical protein